MSGEGMSGLVSFSFCCRRSVVASLFAGISCRGPLPWPDWVTAFFLNRQTILF